MKRIKLTQGKYAIVDDWNYEWLSRWKWRVFYSGHNYYAIRTGRTNRKKHIIYMHREIMGLKYKDGKQIDHINTNGIDNREYNLRFCTHSQNQHNRKPNKDAISKYKGVVWNKERRRWIVNIQYKNKRHRWGYFKIEKEAALAYDERAKELHGKFARLNF